MREYSLPPHISDHPLVLRRFSGNRQELMVSNLLKRHLQSKETMAPVAWSKGRFQQTRKKDLDWPN